MAHQQHQDRDRHERQARVQRDIDLGQRQAGPADGGAADGRTGIALGYGLFRPDRRGHVLVEATTVTL